MANNNEKVIQYIEKLEREAMDEAVSISSKILSIAGYDKKAASKILESIIEYLEEKKESI